MLPAYLMFRAEGTLVNQKKVRRLYAAEELQVAHFSLGLRL